MFKCHELNVPLNFPFTFSFHCKTATLHSNYFVKSLKWVFDPVAKKWLFINTKLSQSVGKFLNDSTKKNWFRDKLNQKNNDIVDFLLSAPMEL